MNSVFDNPFIAVHLAELDPRQAARIATKLKTSAALKDNAPSAQASTNVVPQTTLSQLTGQFDVTRIPITRLEQMMRDPVIGFALFFIRAQLLRARWKIRCVDARTAAFVDNALREIYPTLVNQYMMKLVFGFQAVIKRFAKTIPDWTYFDPTNPDSPERAVWDEGSIEAIIWKPFVTLPPRTVEPLWTNDGSFDGIHYKPIDTAGGVARETRFDVLHSLWFTNEKESVFGSLWGYPRLGYAYRFWWSFWFNWGLADRHFEKDADPPAVVYYPASKPALIDPDLGEVSRRQQALMIGDRARSNSTIALPSDPVLDDEGRAKSMREWEILFPGKDAGNFEVFQDRFEQLVAFMLQAMMVPEEAFRARGGSAGYNSTGQLQEAFSGSMVVLQQEFDFDLQQYVIPQIVAGNDLVDSNGRPFRATKVTRGFDAESNQVALSIVQGAANSDVSRLGIDVRALAEELGLPVLSSEAIRARESELGRISQEKPDETRADPASGDVGVTRRGLYYRPREVIKLSDPETDSQSAFVSELIQVAALRDPAVLLDANGLRHVWRQSISFDFGVASNLLEDYKGRIDLDENFFERLVRRIRSRAHETAAQTRRALMSIMRRAAKVELDRAGYDEFSWDPLYSDAASRYLREQSEIMINDITETTKDQIRIYLSDLVRRNVDPEHMPALLRSHFEMFSGFRADRIVRTEVSNAYNMATLFAAQELRVPRVRAIDAQLGPERSDPHCIERNGKMFSIRQAFIEQRDEHPNGTLQWEIPKKRRTTRRN